MKNKQKQLRNAELAWILNNDPARLRIRTVFSERGKGRKDRPRDNSIDYSSF